MRVTNRFRPYSLLAKLRSLLFPTREKQQPSETLQKKIDPKNAANSMHAEELEVSFPIYSQERPDKDKDVQKITPKHTITAGDPNLEIPPNSPLQHDPVSQGKQLETKPRTVVSPVKFRPSFLSDTLAQKKHAMKYISKCTSKISAFRREYEARLESREIIRQQSGFSRSLLRSKLRKFFKKRLVRGRPVFPPPFQVSLKSPDSVLKGLEAARDQLISNSAWWEKEMLPDASDRVRSTEGPAAKKYSKIVESLAPNATELVKASRGIPKLLEHLMTKKKHIETLSVFSSEFITPENVDAKIQEAIENPTSFNVPVEEMLKQQYKADMIFSAISEAVDKKTGFSKQAVESIPSSMQRKKSQNALENYSFPKAS
ncbi:hypothetical protein MDAP_002869 [Mitosporidium daphniae]|uniref:Uncharacterized protein n=1 Tax=Mitosporidium daphniae TaxID=1485682 RepID=A0A098VVG2_9MICR|nr:uncharacterized protein DI09_123p70 [Mitosporidium daphniae]KGG52927.1 hypothetical protein DI09_123p70 [Mitosporidium daphniae]|eukprot:XP_013239363.1 uncharacterized protein DI09_123p70 [Mitosporidium daphniae]